MASALPPNLHVEIAQDRGRLSSDSTSSRSPMRRIDSNPHERIQSLHGDVQYMPSPSSRFMPQQGTISEEPSGMLSAADLAAQLDEEEEEDEEDISEKIGVMHDGRWYDDRSPRSSESSYSSHMQGTQAQGFAPRQGSLNASSNSRPYPGIGVYAGAGAQPKSNMQNSMVNSPPASIRSRPSLQTPPPRSSSVPDPHGGPGNGMSLHISTNGNHLAGMHTAPSTPTGLHGHGNGYEFDQINPPNTAPFRPEGYAAQQQFQQPAPQAFADKPRFTLTDDGPASPGPGSPSIRRAVSDSNFHPEGESPLSAGLTPPGRRANRVPSSPSKYNTFEEMGISAKTQGQAQAEKEKECVIM